MLMMSVHMTDTSRPFITVAMPVRNEESFVRVTLMELLDQHYPSELFEIIVADGESADSTREFVEEVARTHPQVILMSNPGRLSSSGRNVGFRNGKGDIFLVIDGHCKIDNKRLLRNVVECFEKSNAQCLGRPQPYIVPEEPTMQRAIALVRTSWLGHSSNSYIHSNKEGFVSPVSVGCAYKREVIESIGFLDESFDACEDLEFNYRVQKAGFKTFFSPKIAVSYYPRPDLGGLWHQLLRYGEGRSRFMFKYPETVNLDMSLPVIFILGASLGPILVFLNIYLLWTYITFLFLYLTIVAIESMRLSSRSRLAFTLKLIVAFVTLHVGIGIGLLKGIYKAISGNLGNCS